MKKNQRNNRVKPKRKRKDPNSQKKKVDHYVKLQARANSDGVVRFEFGEAGEVICHEAIEGTVESYSSYKRDSGKEKYVSGSPGTGKRAHVQQRNNIRSKYQFLAGMDTNDYEYKGQKLSIASAYLSTSSILEDTFVTKILPSFIISEVKPPINSEVVGWHMFFKHIFPLLELGGARLGFVVDSELGKHKSINNREEAYYNNFMLPDNVDLLYASSDTGTDAPNKLIRACDKASRELFSQLKNGTLTIPEVLGAPSNDYSGYAYVNYDGSPITVQV